MSRLAIATITADEELWGSLSDELKEKFMDRVSDAVDQADAGFEDLDKNLDLEVIIE